MPVLLALKADLVLATQLVLRHRASRLVILLAITIVAVFLLRTPGPGQDSAGPAIALMVGGMVAAVAGSRPLAPGAPLASAYWVAAPWWLVPLGRLLGVLAVTLPVVSIGFIAVAPDLPARVVLRMVVAAVIYPATVAAAVLMLAPLTGSSFVATLGFVSAWVGAATPSVVDAALQRWPVVRGPIVFLWNVLPLSWRAVRWIGEGHVAYLIQLVVWLCVGVAGTGWAISGAYRSRRETGGGTA